MRDDFRLQDQLKSKIEKVPEEYKRVTLAVIVLIFFVQAIYLLTTSLRDVTNPTNVPKTEINKIEKLEKNG